MTYVLPKQINLNSFLLFALNNYVQLSLSPRNSLIIHHSRFITVFYCMSVFAFLYVLFTAPCCYAWLFVYPVANFLVTARRNKRMYAGRRSTECLSTFSCTCAVSLSYLDCTQIIAFGTRRVVVKAHTFDNGCQVTGHAHGWAFHRRTEFISSNIVFNEPMSIALVWESNTMSKLHCINTTQY